MSFWVEFAFNASFLLAVLAFIVTGLTVVLAVGVSEDKKLNGSIAAFAVRVLVTGVTVSLLLWFASAATCAYSSSERKKANKPVAAERAP